MSTSDYSDYKLIKLPSTARYNRKSLWGVKSRVSGKNRKGQVAHGVGSMDPNLAMEQGGCMRAR